jgi:Exocyst complex component Sec10
MRDLSEYQKCMRKFNNAEVDDVFAQLREIANIFLVAPQNLDNVLDDLF